MGSFSGILGTNQSVLGKILLGSKGSAGTAGAASSSVVVAQDVQFVLVMGLSQRLTQSITTQSVIENTKASTKNLATQVSVTETIGITPSPWTHVTQMLVEVGYAPTLTPVHLTQLVVEIAYKRDTRQSLTHHVSVFSGANIPVAVTESVTHAQHVAQTLAQRSTGVPLTVHHAQHATWTIGQHGALPKSITHAQHVTQSIGKHGPMPETVSSSVHTAQAILVGGVHRLGVTNVVTVNQTQTLLTNPNHQAVSNAATVKQGIGYAGINDFISVNTTTKVNQTIGVRSTDVRLSVKHIVHVSSNPTSRNTEYDITVVSHIKINQGPTFRNTNVRIGVVSGIHVSVPEEERTAPIHEVFDHAISVNSLPILANLPRDSVQTNVHVNPVITWKNTNPRLSVTSAIKTNSAVSFQSPNLAVSHTGSVSQTIKYRNTNVKLSYTTVAHANPQIVAHPNPLRLSVASAVTVQKYNFSPTNFVLKVSVTPDRQSVNTFVTTATNIAGGSSNRKIPVFQAVTVTADMRINQQYNGFKDYVAVGSYIRCSPNPNRQSVTNSVTVGSNIDYRATATVITVSQKCLVTSTLSGHGPIVNQGVKSAVLVTPYVWNSVLPEEMLHDSMHVTSSVTDRTSPNRQSITSSVHVGESVSPHNNHPRLTISSPVHVNSRPQCDMYIRSRVSVQQKINRNTLYHMLQKLGLDDTIEVVRQHVVSITQTLGLEDSAIREITYDRSLTNQLVFADPYRNVWVDINDEYIPVPIAIGVIVTDYITIIAGSQTIVLPPPQFDDSQANVASVDIKRSVTGLSYVHVKRTDRRKLSWTLKLGLDKVTELRLFMQTAISQKITVIDWQGTQWYGRFTCNPFEFLSESRYIGQKEKLDITLEFEAIKLT